MKRIQTYRCPHCLVEMDIEDGEPGELANCPKCRKQFQLAKVPPKKPKIKTRGEIMGVGGVIQAFGLILCFLWFPIGLIFGILLIIGGGIMSRKCYCSECGNRVDNNQVKMCPTCRACF